MEQIITQRTILCTITMQYTQYASKTNLAKESIVDYYNINRILLLLANLPVTMATYLLTTGARNAFNSVYARKVTAYYNIPNGASCEALRPLEVIRPSSLSWGNLSRSRRQ